MNTIDSELIEASSTDAIQPISKSYSGKMSKPSPAEGFKGQIKSMGSRASNGILPLESNRDASSRSGLDGRSTPILTGLNSPDEAPLSVFATITQFEHAQRMAATLVQSSLVPDHYHGEQHLGNCLIALDLANRIRVPVLSVMLNLQNIEGRPVWSAQFLISCVNASQRFTPIRFQMIGKRGGDDFGCFAWAKDRTGQVIKSPEVTVKMAKGCGWFDRPGTKWKTMPQLMLCYRSATLFARLYAPDIAMGIQTTEEIADLHSPGRANPTQPVFDRNRTSETRGQTARKPRRLEKDAALPHTNGSTPGESHTKNNRSEVPTGRTKTANLPDARHGPLNTSSRPVACYNYYKALQGLLKVSNHSDSEVLSFLQRTGRCDSALTSLAESAKKRPEAVVWAHDNWKALERELTRMKQGGVSNA